MGIATVLVLLAAISPLPAAAEHSSTVHAGVAPTHHTHTVGLFVGGASDNFGRRDEGVAVGLEYEYRLSKSFGIGAMVEHTYGDLDTWVYVVPLAYHAGPWKFYAAPGIEDGHHGSESMLRVGFEYGFHVGTWEISPQVDMDLIERERDVFVMGLTFLRGFDF